MKKNVCYLLFCAMSFLFIIFSCKDQEEILNSDLIDNTDLIDESLFKSSIRYSRLWPDGIIYYKFHSNMPLYGINKVLDAMRDWEQATDNVISFLDKDLYPSQQNYIEIILSDSINSSYVGMLGGIQQIYFTNTFSDYLTRHELGHSIGLNHEHQKPNRDLFIKLNENHSATEHNLYNSNYDIECNYIYYNDEFDFESIMLGGAGGIAFKLPDLTNYNLNDSISSGDANTVKNLYNMSMSELDWIPEFENGQPNLELNIQSGMFKLSWNLCSNAAKFLVIAKKKEGIIKNKYIGETTNNFIYFLFEDNACSYERLYLYPVSENNTIPYFIRSISLDDKYFSNLEGENNTYIWCSINGVKERAIYKYTLSNYLTNFDDYTWDVSGNIELVCNDKYSVQVRASYLIPPRRPAEGTITFRDLTNCTVVTRNVSFQYATTLNYLFPDPCI